MIVDIPRGSHWVDVWRWAYRRYMLDLAKKATSAKADGKELKLDVGREQARACVFAARYVAQRVKQGDSK